MIGNDKDFLPTRVSYKLNLRGPSVNVQTACSTSLVAVHLACQSLLDRRVRHGAGRRRVDPVPAAGRLPLPGGRHPLARRPLPRRSTRARPGTVAGSGVGVVVLKRLSRRAGRRRHDPRRDQGLGHQQRRRRRRSATRRRASTARRAVIRAAHQAAGVDPTTIGYVEAHGTGTPLGDPIEIAALTQAFRAGTDRTRLLRDRLGEDQHRPPRRRGRRRRPDQDGAALQHRPDPAQPALRDAEPADRLRRQPVLRQRSTASVWTGDGTPRRAGVSSFGIGGTNAHVVLEEAPAPDRRLARRAPWQLLRCRPGRRPRSERRDRSRSRRISRAAGHDATSPTSPTRCTSAGRALRHRRAVVCRTTRRGVDGARPRATAAGPDARVAASAADQPVAFLFPGPGRAVRRHGARALRARSGLPRRDSTAAPNCSTPHLGGLDLRDVLFSGRCADAGERRLRQTWLTQPALFVVEYALARLWMSWGVAPAAMIGHSIGEYVAACLAGVLLARGRAAAGGAARPADAGAADGRHAGGAAGRSEAEAARCDAAASASPRSTAPRRACSPARTRRSRELEQTLAAQGDARPAAAHVARVPLGDDGSGARGVRGRRARECRLRAPRIPFVSNVTGTWITAGGGHRPRLLGAPPARDGAVRRRASTRCSRWTSRCFLEVGTGRHARRVRPQAGRRDEAGALTVVSSLPSHDQAATTTRQIVAAIGELWVAGVTVDWTGVHRGERARPGCRCPPIPFERQRYLHRARSGRRPVAPSGVGPIAPTGSTLPSWERGRALTRRSICAATVSSSATARSPRTCARRCAAPARSGDRGHVGDGLPRGRATMRFIGSTPGSLDDLASRGRSRVRPRRRPTIVSAWTTSHRRGLRGRPISACLARPGDLAATRRIAVESDARHRRRFDVTGGSRSGRSVPRSWPPRASSPANTRTSPAA